MSPRRGSSGPWLGDFAGNGVEVLFKLLNLGIVIGYLTGSSHIAVAFRELFGQSLGEKS
jgi:hypothetical protein